MAFTQQDGNEIGFHNRVGDAHDRGMEALFTPSRLKDVDENVIHFDFETIPSASGNPAGHATQEPFELGLSVLNNKTGEMVHETFRFTPQAINAVAGNARKFNSVGDGTDVADAMSVQYRILGYGGEGLEPADDGFDEFKDTNITEIEGLIKPYVNGTDDGGKAVGWEEINKFLTKNHVNLKHNTNFVAWNGSFDYPLLEKLLLRAGGMGSHLATLYTKASGGRGRNYLDQPSGVEMLGGKGGKYPNPNYQEGARRINDREASNFRHDAMIESARLFGHQGVGVGPHRLVALSDPVQASLDADGNIVSNRKIDSRANENGYAFNKFGYNPNMEWGYDTFAAGSALDGWRHIIASRCFGSEGDFPVETGELNNSINDIFSNIDSKTRQPNLKRREDFIKRILGDAGLKHVEHILEVEYRHLSKKVLNPEGVKIAEYTPRHWFEAVMESSAHSGMGDTAFMSELLLPMFGSFIDHFDPKRIKNLTTEEAAAFSTDAATFLRGWGDPLAIAPKADPEGGWSNPTATLSEDVGKPGNFVSDLHNQINDITSDEKTDEKTDEKAETASMFTQEETGNPDFNRMKEKNVLPSKKSFSDAAQRSYIGDIKYVKWVGPDSKGEIKERPVAIVTIGGTRVPFSASMQDENGKSTDQIQRWIPFSGAVNRYPYRDEDKEELPVAERMSEGIAQFFVNLSNARLKELGLSLNTTAVMPELGKAINDVLMGGVAAIQKHIEGEKMQPLLHQALNEEINTAASRALNDTFKAGGAVTYKESNSLLPLDGRSMDERRAAYQVLLQTELDKFYGAGEDDQSTIERSHEEMAGVITLLLSSAHEGIGSDPEVPFPRLEAIDKETLGISEDWFNQQEALVELLNNGALINGTVISMERGEMGDEPIKTAEDGTVSVNIDRMFNDYIHGKGLEEIGISQFMNRSNRIEEGAWTGSLAQQLLGFIGCSTRINGLNMSSTDAVQDVFDPQDIILPDNEVPIPPQPGEPSEESSEEEVSGLADAWLVFGNPYEEEEDSWVLQNASPEALEKARNRWAYYNWGQEHPDGTPEKLQAWENQQVKLLGSPFIDEWQIKSALAQATKQEAFDEIFPQRELAENEEGVSQLINDAIETYGENSKLPSASILVRELEWIRVTHPEHFTKEILAEVLNVDESVAMEHVAGRWMAAVNMGYGAMGDKAQEEIALIEQERVHMGNDRFMGSAHREFLRNQLISSGQTDWAPVEEPTTPSQQIMEESDEPLISWGDLARQMAVGTAKSPVNALKYLTNWNQISTQAKDAVSGRTDAGKKLMEAAGKDEDLFRVNIGTEEEPKFISRISDFNYYTGNLPIQGDEQRGFLARFLSGPKTFDDLRGEEDKPDYKTRQKNIGTALDRLHDYTEQEVRNRFKPTPTTDEEQQAAVGVQAQGQRAQNKWEIGVESGLEGQINPPPLPEEPKGIIPKTQYNPKTNQYDPVEKSLDRLREYLLRV